MKAYKIMPLLFAVTLLAFSCSSGSTGSGIIGIEVPVGSGKVSDDMPYLVSGVYENTPAFKAGIRPGDIITQINDMPITKGMRFDEIFSKQLRGKPGSKVVISVKRGDEHLVFSIIRAERGD